MLSSNALKYNIVVRDSFYAAVVVMGLYAALICLLLFTFTVSWLTLPFLSLLIIIAIYGGQKAYKQNYNLRLSDSGELQILFANGDLMKGKITSASFYNSVFLSLQIKKPLHSIADLGVNKKNSQIRIVIYRDAVSEEQYRLLARVINFGLV